MGAELKSDGTVAAMFVIIGIGLYLWIRFERRFAIAALVTEVHDVLVTLGIIALVQREFDMTVLASVLAVIGYSINDKVVVFDRIRELFRLARKAEPEEILNRSINNTLVANHHHLVVHRRSPWARCISSAARRCTASPSPC